MNEKIKINIEQTSGVRSRFRFEVCLLEGFGVFDRDRDLDFFVDFFPGDLPCLGLFEPE